MAGTVFLDVLIWKCYHGDAASGYDMEQSCTPLFCLKGHKGSIHRCCIALKDSHASHVAGLTRAHNALVTLVYHSGSSYAQQ